jgi:uncharacterized protein YecT (DUF1311 family)
MVDDLYTTKDEGEPRGTVRLLRARDQRFQRRTLRGPSGSEGIGEARRRARHADERVVAAAESRVRSTAEGRGRDFEAGRFPTTVDFKNADRALNTAYAKAMKPGAFGDSGAVRPSGAKKTQRLWIPYRDARVALAAVRYPKLSADGVKA